MKRQLYIFWIGIQVMAIVVGGLLICAGVSKLIGRIPKYMFDWIFGTILTITFIYSLGILFTDRNKDKKTNHGNP